MKRETKLTSEQLAQEHSVERQTEQSAALEFPHADEMIRHDALHTPVPPTVADRLDASLAQLAPRRPWWRRWLGR